MRKKFSVLLMVVNFTLVSLACNASAQKRGPVIQETGTKGRMQSLVVDLSKSNDPGAARLGRKIKFVAKEIQSDRKDLRPLQPYLSRMEKAARAGDFETADKALLDAVDKAYNAEFWKEVTIESVDGFKVYSYLSKPKNRKEYPIIVLVHGGEHGSATTYERHALRFLKAGFATLAVDYRGSSGHGDSYKAAGDFGGKEIDDVVKAVEYAYADPATSSVGLMGSSHGAFVSSNVLTRSSLVTAANLNFGGYDFEALMKSWEASSAPEAQRHVEVWAPIIGDPGSAEYERAFTLSAIYNVDKIEAPLLLIHGKNDRSVPCQESVNFYEELKRNNKKATLKLFDDGPHGFIFRNSDEAEEAYQITESFFKRNLK